MSKAKAVGPLLCWAIAACGGATGEWAGTVTDSAGVAIVQNPATGLWRGSSEWRVEETLRIGTAEGDPNYQFGTIAGLDVGADGSIYVLDQQAQHVRVYDSNGVYVRTIGRPGNGPGELSQAAGPVLVGRGDTVFVADGMNQRVNRYLPDGTPVGSFALPMTSGIATRWAHMPGGRFAQEQRPIPMPIPGAQSTRMVHAVLVRGTDGAVLDTLLHLPEGKTIQAQGGSMQVRVFETEPLWDVWPDGSSASGVSTDYRIEIRGPDGRLERIVKRPFERQPVTQADQQTIRQALERLLEQQGAPPVARQMLLQSLTFAEHYPAFANLMAGPAGTLWVQHVQTAADVAASGEIDLQDLGAANWDVFDAEGRYLGVVRFPDRFNPMRFVGNDVYGVWRDELDVQHVMRLRVVGIGTDA